MSILDEQLAEGRKREQLTFWVNADQVLGQTSDNLAHFGSFTGKKPVDDRGVPLARNTFEGVFQDIFDEAFELLVERQMKYGSTNIAQQGMWGVLTRIADDKISRLKRSFNGSIRSGQIVLDEITDREADDTFEDACLDVMNYAAILLALKRGLWGKPLAADLR